MTTQSYSFSTVSLSTFESLYASYFTEYVRGVLASPPVSTLDCLQWAVEQNDVFASILRN
jgi:hypothetical protein